MAWTDTKAGRRIAGRLLILALVGISCSSGEAAEEVPGPAADSLQASGEDRTVAQHIEDATLEVRVHKALLDTAALRPFRFELDVQDGQVALRGSVQTLEQRHLAEAIVRSIEGVAAVRNDLSVTADSARTQADSVQAGG